MVPQERILDELGTEMDSTSNRLDFVQVSIMCPWLEVWTHINNFWTYCPKNFFNLRLIDFSLYIYEMQKKVAMVMKKASVKGQILMIFFLIVLFIILFVLVFLT